MTDRFERKKMLKDIIQLKELTKYRFNLDKKLFEMKQERKKIIEKDIGDYVPNATYIRTGMAFFPRTTFYEKEKMQNATFNKNKYFQNSPSPRASYQINKELLKTYSRSLSPIIQIRDKIHLETTTQKNPKETKYLIN